MTVRGRHTEGVVTLEAQLDADEVAYVDAAWVGEDGPVPALTYADGALRFGARPPRAVMAEEADRAARQAFERVAGRAAVAVESFDSDHVEVLGAGIVAEEVRRLIGAAGPRIDEPHAIVDTTGDPQLIDDALSRLSDLGTLVLAGEGGRRTLTYDLYTHVHLRGLRIVGVAPLLAEDENERPAVDTSSLAAPHRARPGESLPNHGWYRLSF